MPTQSGRSDDRPLSSFSDVLDVLRAFAACAVLMLMITLEKFHGKYGVMGGKIIEETARFLCQ